MVCVFCHKPTDVKKVSSGASSYLCGDCVQALLNQSQENLLRGYNLAIEKGYAEKAKTIKSFMEVSDEPVKPEQHDRHFNRKGVTRPVRNEKSRIGRFKA